MASGNTNLLTRLKDAGSVLFSTPMAGVIGGLAFGCGIVLCLAMSVDNLRMRVMQPVDEVTIRFIDAPIWVGHSLHDHLASIASPWLLGTSLQRIDLVNAREALIASGCFQDIHQVRRSGLTIVEITATFLEPGARVIDGEGVLLIDDRSIILPEGYRVGNDTHLVNLTSPAYGRPTNGQRHWPGEDVASALALLHAINGQEWLPQVESIDLHGFETSRKLVLVTDLGTRIIWGSPPGRETALEALAHQKIVRLSWLNTHHGRIDQHHRGEIDVTDSSFVTKR